MHHRILIKVKGDSEEEALGNVKEILDGTIRCGACERSVRGINWDYYSDPILLSKESIKKLSKKDPNWAKHKTPEDFANELIAHRETAMQELKDKLKDSILQNFLITHMPRKEAPLYADHPNKAVREKVEQVLKSGEDKQLPQTISEIGELTAELLSSRQGGFMIPYYMKKIEALREVLEFGNSDGGIYVLHCDDNNYADMTEDTEGEKEYYFWCDRHF